MATTKSGKAPVRVAALADIHYRKASKGALLSLFKQAGESADVLFLCGDLTDYGLVEEAEILAQDLTASLQIPILAVLGNHDFESGRQDQIREILQGAGVAMLDGESCE